MPIIEGSLPEIIPSYQTNMAFFRIGIIPFDAPSNLSGGYPSLVDAGAFLAQEVRLSLLSYATLTSQASPTSFELVNLYDWSGKREDFKEGNIRAMSWARLSGYQAVIVGELSQNVSLSLLSSRVKVISLIRQETTAFHECSVSKVVSRTQWSASKLPLLIPPWGIPDLKELGRCIAKTLSAD